MAAEGVVRVTTTTASAALEYFTNMICGVWCVVCGVWRVVCGMWLMVGGAWWPVVAREGRRSRAGSG